MHKKGRDPFVADLAKNHGSTPDPSRKYEEGDNDGVIYVLMCRVNLNIYRTADNSAPR